LEVNNMALVIENFKGIGGPGNSQGGGQMYSVFSDTDNLGDMVADGYLDGLSTKLRVRDLIVLSGVEGSKLVQISSNVAGVVQVKDIIVSTTAQSLIGPGAINLTTPVTEITTTGPSDAYTLADGFIGQRKAILQIVHGGNGVLTPDNFIGATMVTFTDQGDTVTLEFRTGGWIVVADGGIGGGPVIA
jgi:hypothetical protein